MTLSPASLVATHDGTTTHYLEAGATTHPTVLLVHDGWFGADARTLWTPLIELLADEFHVLAPDMLGFGGTDKTVRFDRSMYAYRAAHLGSFVRAVLTDAGDVHGVGTSMGGSILLRDVVAATPQIPLRSVVSISGSGGPWRSAFGAAQLGEYSGTRDDITRVMDHMAGDFPGRDGVVDTRHANTRVRGHVESLLVGTLKHPVPADPPPADGWPAPLRDVTVPVTVVAGADDPLLEPGWQTRLDGLSPLLSTRLLPTRHAPSLDHPALVADVVRQHLAGAPRPATRAGAR